MLRTVVDVDAAVVREMLERAAEEKAEMLVGAERADARRRIDCLVMVNGWCYVLQWFGCLVCYMAYCVVAPQLITTSRSPPHRSIERDLLSHESSISKSFDYYSYVGQVS